MTQFLPKDDILAHLEKSKSNQGIPFYDHIKKLLLKIVNEKNSEMKNMNNFE
jgi:hypothetical protein